MGRLGRPNFVPYCLGLGTSLQYVLDIHPRTRPLVVLQVDLFSARGAFPDTHVDVAERLKDIRFSSRTRAVTLALERGFLPRP